MTNRPPFTHQLDHRRQQTARQAEVHRMRAQYGSPAALDEAFHTYENALQSNPDDLELRQCYAKLLLEQADYPRAIEQWQWLIARFPNMADWHVDLGEVFNAAGDLPAALAQFDEAEKIDPSLRATVLYHRGAALLAHGKDAEAEQDFRRTLELDPRMAKAQNSLGVILLAAKKTAEAKQAFQRAVEADPLLFSAQCNLADLLEKEGKLPEALAAYRQAVEAEADDLRPYLGIARVCSKMGDLPKAIEPVRRAVATMPDNVDACCFSGRLAGQMRSICRGGGRLPCGLEDGAELSGGGSQSWPRAGEIRPHGRSDRTVSKRPAEPSRFDAHEGKPAAAHGAIAMTAILGVSAFYHDSAAVRFQHVVDVLQSQPRSTGGAVHSQEARFFLSGSIHSLLPGGGGTRTGRSGLRGLLRQAALEVRAAAGDVPGICTVGLSFVPYCHAGMVARKAAPAARNAERASREIPQAFRVRRAPRIPRGQRVFPFAIRRGGDPYHGRRRRMGGRKLGHRSRQPHRARAGDAFSTLVGAAVFRLHLLLRLPGQLGRIQADGPCTLRRAAAMHIADPREADRLDARRIVSPRYVVLQLLPRDDNDFAAVRSALRRAAAQSGKSARATGNGFGGFHPARNRRRCAPRRAAFA